MGTGNKEPQRIGYSGPIIGDLSPQRRDALYPCLGNVQSGGSINCSATMELQPVDITRRLPYHTQVS